MAGGNGMEHRLDPLGDLEVKRVLAFARAREAYPSVPRGLLLDYCQAAWRAAVAGGEEHDVVGRFERALMLVAWTHRRSPHLNFRELVDQVIPQVALRPFMAQADSAPVEEAPVAEPEHAVKRDAVRPPARRLIPRVPFASPVPLGAAVAAGFIGVTMLGQTGALPAAPFAPAGNDDASGGDGHHHHGAAPASPRSTPTGGGAAASGPGRPTAIGVAQAPEAATGLKAQASASGGRASSAAKKASAPAKLVSVPTQAPPAPAPVPAPAAPVQPVEQVEQQLPDVGGAPSESQRPSDWVPEHAEVQAPAAPIDPGPAQGTDPGPTAGNEGNTHRFGHAEPPQPDHFEAIDLNQAQTPQSDSDAGAQTPTPPPATTQSGPQVAQPPAEPPPAAQPQPTPPAPQPPAPAQVGPPPAPQK